MSKIQLCDKYKCTQCMACVNTCPKNCINMVDAGEGFSIPQIDRDACVECGACMNVCHIISPAVERSTPLKTLACWTKNDEDRKKSSSGGAFSVLAREVLSKNGVVFGAAMDTNLQVKHIGIEKYDSVLVRAIEKCDLLELSNIYFIREDAMEIEKIFDSEIDKI